MQTGELIPARISEPEGVIQIPCLKLKVQVNPVIPAVCNAPASRALRIQFAPQSTDGAPLQLLTLSTEDELDVVFNVNEPVSAPVPPPNSPPIYNYEFILDTGNMPPGTRTFQARLLNVDDEEVRVSVPLVIDQVAPTASISFPAEGDRICGVPREVTIDGATETFSVMSVEGLVQDNNRMGYLLELNPGNEYNAATAVHFHDSNIDLKLNSFGAANGLSSPTQRSTFTTPRKLQNMIPILI